MNRESLRESLSAVMDNEADELELRRVLAADDEPELLTTWSRYQIARAAMRGEYFAPGLSLAAGVSAALDAEPALRPARAGLPIWRSVGRVAIAASVTVAVLAGVRFYNQDALDGAQMAQQTVQPVAPSGSAAPLVVQGPAVLAGYSTSGEAALAVPADQERQLAAEDQRLLDYVRQHARQAGSGAETTLPHARAASLENR